MPPTLGATYMERKAKKIKEIKCLYNSEKKELFPDIDKFNGTIVSIKDEYDKKIYVNPDIPEFTSRKLRRES